MTYHYFVAYVWKDNDGAGAGNAIAKINKPISGSVQIDEITTEIEKGTQDEIVITNFILLKTEE